MEHYALEEEWFQKAQQLEFHPYLSELKPKYRDLYEKGQELSHKATCIHTHADPRIRILSASECVAQSAAAQALDDEPYKGTEWDPYILWSCRVCEFRKGERSRVTQWMARKRAVLHLVHKCVHFRVPRRFLELES